MSQVMETIELRCDANPRRLFAKLLVRETPHVADGNLLEFSCRDCRASLRASGAGAEVVLHRFDVAGELVETVVVRAGGALE